MSATEKRNVKQSDGEVDLEVRPIHPLIHKPKNEKRAISLFVSDCVCRNGKVAFKIDPQVTDKKKTEEQQSIENTPEKQNDLIGEFKVDEKTKILIQDKQLAQLSDAKHESNFWGMWKNNWRQYTSVIPGILLLSIIGSQVCYTISDLDRNTVLPAVYLRPGSPKMHLIPNFDKQILILAWYVGSVIGSILGAISVQHLKKSTIYYIGALLQVISGALYVFFIRNSYFGQIEVRIMSGIIYGIIHLTVTVHASDMPSKKMRQVISKSITSSIVLSILITAIMNPMLGIIDFEGYDMICWGVLTIIITPFLSNETVSFLLMRKESSALKNLAKLNSEREASTKTLQEFDELKTMVAEDCSNGKNIFTGGNLRPLFLIINARLLSLFTSNIPLTLFMIGILRNDLLKYSDQNLWLSEIYLSRMVVGFIVLFISYWSGRHQFFYTLTILCANTILFADVGSLFLPTANDYATWTFVSRCTYYLTNSLLSFGLDTYQHIQTVEAFTTTNKAWSISTVAIVEHIVHMILIWAYLNGINFTIVASILAFLIIPTILLIMMPKTRGLSLRETRNKFNKYMSQRPAEISTEC